MSEIYSLCRFVFYLCKFFLENLQNFWMISCFWTWRSNYFFLYIMYWWCVFYQTSLQDALKQKEDLKKEVYFLRSELQQVRDDRENQLAQVQTLTSEIANYKELTGKSSKELDNIMAKTNALEVCCLVL